MKHGSHTHLTRFRMSAIYSVAIFALLSLATVCAEQAPDAGQSSDFPVAVVNGEQIMDSELDALIQDYAAKRGAPEITDEVRRTILQGMIRRRLILAQEDAAKLRQNKEIAASVKEYEDGLVIKRFLEDKVGKHVSANHDELLKYYEENRSQFAFRPKVVASHILLKTKEEADKALERLKAGEDFKALAKELSIDLPMALEGGSMGTIEQGRSLPELEKELFTLKEKEFSGVVSTRFGYHILTVDQIIPAQFKPFDEVQEDIKKAVLRGKEAKAFNEMAEKLENGAEITVYEKLLSSVGK